MWGFPGKVGQLGLIAPVLLGVLVAPAQAADMLGEPVFEHAGPSTEVEFGTGWYIRGDIGVGFTDFEHGDDTFSSPLVLNAGVGYMLGTSFRAEFAASHYGNISGNTTDTDCGAEPDGTPITGYCTHTVDGDPQATTLMANFYYDTPEIHGLRGYVGVGAGVAIVQYGIVQEDYDCYAGANGDCGATGYVPHTQQSSSTHQNDLQLAAAAALTFGLSYKLDKNLHLDAGYRYTLVPSVEGFRGDNSTDTIHLNEIKVGLRYEIW